MADTGRSPSGSGHSAEPEPSCTVSAVPVSVPNAARSIAERLGKFKVVCSCSASETTLSLSGQLETQDELDALTEALAVMREWLPLEARQYSRGSLEAMCRAMRGAMGDHGTDWQEYAPAAARALLAMPKSAVTNAIGTETGPEQEKA